VKSVLFIQIILELAHSVRFGLSVLEDFHDLSVRNMYNQYN